MSDSIQAFTVTLDQDLPKEAADQVIQAIGLIKHVSGVTPVHTDSTDLMARQRVRCNLHISMLKAVNAVFDGKPRTWE